jgi:hypothetical protein
LREVRIKKLEQQNENRRHNIGNCTTEDHRTLRRQLMKKKNKITINDTKTGTRKLIGAKNKKK